jgi:hypothetical protein
MLYVVAVGLMLVNALCLVLVLFRLPGIWLMLLFTVLAAWWGWDEGMFSVWTLVAVLLLAVLSEIIEFLAGAVGARTMGGSGWSALAALGGAILGAVVGTFTIPAPVLGSLAGAIGGAWLAAWTVELMLGRRMHEAFRSGAGAGMGTLAGAVSKLAIALLVWLIITVAAFWP